MNIVLDNCLIHLQNLDICIGAETLARKIVIYAFIWVPIFFIGTSWLPIRWPWQAFDKLTEILEKRRRRLETDHSNITSRLGNLRRSRYHEYIEQKPALNEEQRRLKSKIQRINSFLSHDTLIGRKIKWPVICTLFSISTLAFSIILVSYYCPLPADNKAVHRCTNCILIRLLFLTLIGGFIFWLIQFKFLLKGSFLQFD